MIYELKQFQRDAVNEIKEYFELYFKATSRKSIVFKSPTGSGKTFMASSLFEELANEHPDLDFCVMWACPGKGELQKQSFDNVKYYLGGNPTCTLLEDDFFGSRTFIKKHEIVFVNWEKLIQKDKETGKWANNLMKDQEGENFINVVGRTNKNGTKIILVIDESHIGHSQKARVTEFVDTIVKPDIILSMSATPLDEHIDVEVDPQRVIDEGLIKEDVIVNEGIREEDKDLEEQDSELLVLQKGYDKRIELLNAYKEIGSIVNPLVLIQIPNVDEGEAKKLVIKDFLRDKGITEENGLLKLWCDNGGNFDKKKIRQIDDATQFLIFKTSVATGWDCPRAQVLVKFRDGKSETFEIQTIGRILRTAEAKSYQNPLLDNAYIYTNIQDFETKKDTYNPNRIKTEMAYINKKFTKLTFNEGTKLRSFYRSREGDYNSADSRFYAIYEKAFMEVLGFAEEDKLFLKVNGQEAKNATILISKKVDLSLETKDSILPESLLESVSIDKEQKIGDGKVKVTMADNDVQAVINNMIRSNLSGLAYIRSKSPVIGAMIETFSKFYCPFSRSEKVKSIERIIVNNYDTFAEILSKATTEYRQILIANAGKKGIKYDFKIEDKRAYSRETHTKLDWASKSFYQPLFVLLKENGQINHLEEKFLRKIEASNAVSWYWENGAELMKINFGISCSNGMKTFQPDFIVKFSDGTVDIFDTKAAEERTEDTKLKAEELQKYIDETNTNRGHDPMVVGGIVIKVNEQFLLNCKSTYKTYSEAPNDWVNFNELLRSKSDYGWDVIQFVLNKCK